MSLKENAYTDFGGVRTGSVLGLQLGSGSTQPTTEGQITYVDGVGFRAYGESGAFTLGSGGSSGVTGGLDSAYSIDRTIGLDEGALQLTDATSGSANSVEIYKTGAGSGNVFDFNIDAALTGNVLNLDMNLGTAAVGMHIDNGATARTGSDILVTGDSTGAHSVIDINASGSGALVGFDYTGSYNGSPAGQVFKVTFDANDNLDTEVLEVTTGAGNRAIMFDLNFGHTDSGTTSHIFDIDVSGIIDSNIFDFATSAACTGNVFNLVMDNAVAGTAMRVTGAGVRTQPFIELIGTQTGSADMIDLSADGAFTGSVINLDMNAAVGGKAITLDAGGGTRTAAMILTTFDGDGTTTGGTLWDINVSNTGAAANPLFDIDVSDVYTGNIFDVALGAASTGSVINVDMNLGLASAFLTLDAGNGTRTTDLVDVTFDGDGNISLFDINHSNTGSGNLFDIDVSGIHTGKVISIVYSAAATGDAVELDMTSAVAAKALLITGAGSRSDDLIEINDASTSSASVLDVNMSGAFTGPLVAISSTAAASGNFIQLDTDTGAYTGDFIAGSIDANATGAQFIVFDREGGANNTNLIDITDSTTGSGDLFQLTLDAAGSGMVFDINLSAVHTGNVFDVTYGTAAATGNAIDLNMGTNVAGMAISISSAATGTADEGSALDVQHSGNLVTDADVARIYSSGDHSATSNVLSLVQDTGAGTAGANVLHIKASGTNVEAIEVEEGIVFFAATTATPGSGNGETLPADANVVFYDPNGGSRTGVILTAGLRDGQHIKVVNIADAAETVTFAASGTSNVAIGTTLVLGQFEGVELVWNATRSLWYPLITVFS